MLDFDTRINLDFGVTAWRVGDKISSGTLPLTQKGEGAGALCPPKNINSHSEINRYQMVYYYLVGKIVDLVATIHYLTLHKPSPLRS